MLKFCVGKCTSITDTVIAAIAAAYYIYSISNAQGTALYTLSHIRLHITIWGKSYLLKDEHVEAQNIKQYALLHS